MAKTKKAAVEPAATTSTTFRVVDKFQRHEPEEYTSDLTGDELDAFQTKMRNAYAIEHFLDPANVAIVQ